MPAAFTSVCVFFCPLQHRRANAPSVCGSQNAAAEVCTPAPTFCIRCVVTARRRARGATGGELPSTRTQRARARRKLLARALASLRCQHAPTYFSGLPRDASRLSTPSCRGAQQAAQRRRQLARARGRAARNARDGSRVRAAAQCSRRCGAPRCLPSTAWTWCAGTRPRPPPPPPPAQQARQLCVLAQRAFGARVEKG
jgi:hypothetical protein